MCPVLSSIFQYAEKTLLTIPNTKIYENLLSFAAAKKT
jgi:hypothetical protein